MTNYAQISINMNYSVEGSQYKYKYQVQNKESF